MKKVLNTLISGQGNTFYLLSIVFLLSVLIEQTSVASAKHQNLVDLISQSERIVMGTVSDVSDGYNDKGIPYTQITLQVSETLKGDPDSTYRFRQFGLISPTGSPSGSDYPGTSPVGFLRWENGETVLVFLHQPARLTGLQTTVGLSQGKLKKVHDRFESSTGISNLFENLVVEAGDLSSGQIDMLRDTGDSVDANLLLALLRRAVNENWVGNGVMHYAN